MMQKQVDFAIVGAGTAGLSAVKEIRRLTENFLLIDAGPLGTTCSRVGCMPSKALLQVAHDFHRYKILKDQKLLLGQDRLDIPGVMRQVREYRDHFVAFTLKDINDLGDRFIQGHARFTGPNTLRIDDKIDVTAKKIIIAVGSRAVLPKEWQSLGHRVITSDDFFEQEDLPKTWGVIGLGPIGMEMGQALAWLQRDIFGFGRNGHLGGLQDKVVHAAALKAFEGVFPIHLDSPVQLSSHGDRVRIHFGGQTREVDRILAALGRSPNLEGLDLDKTGCERDEKGLPIFDPSTMVVRGAPLLVAGDFDQHRPILHEAADDGHIAGYNAIRAVPHQFARRVQVALSFTYPQLGFVGEIPKDLTDVALGDVSFENQGRSYLMGENRGALRVFADRKSGRLLAAEFAAPAGEHLAHLLAWSIQQGLSIDELLLLPYYHPTVEEALRTAFRRASKQIDRKPDFEPGPEIAHFKKR